MDIGTIKKISGLLEDMQPVTTDKWELEGLDITDMLTGFYFDEVRRRTRKDALTVQDVIQGSLATLKETAGSLKRIFSGQARGFVLMGLPGTGKTTMLRAIRGLWRYAVRWTAERRDPLTVRMVTAYETAGLVKESGVAWINETDALIVDDIGTEPETVNDFGTVSRPIALTIEEVYRRGGYFFASTNMGGELIRKTYGERVVARLKEAYPPLIIRTESFRK